MTGRGESALPRERAFDSTLAFVSEGYEFISARCRRHRSDVFETRLMLRRVVCAMGEDAARMFYQPGRFTRQGALPPTALLLLQDRGSVQLLDGGEHRHRKAMFMSLMGTESIRGLADVLAEEWRSTFGRRGPAERLVLLDAVEEILCRAACRWAGIPLEEADVGRRTRELSAMIDGAGAVGPRNWRGLALRTRTERWIRRIVEDVRAGAMRAPDGSALRVIAGHRDLAGRLLPRRIAGVELLNLLRPTVAVARYVVFAALALHRHPECRRKLAADGQAYLEWFVQEVRRFYPFFPAVGGRVREAFGWRDRDFTPGDWVLLDLYGTNHDGRLWEAPERFHPERFRDRRGNAFDLIPQGGGDHHTGHRCAGEWITIELVKEAVRLLTTGMRYEVPDQDLRVDLSRMPARPACGFVVRDVRLV